MKKKNGFTLIELLAILVILAIIAVITIPKINKVINESKQNAARNSAYGYKDAIEKWEASQQEDDIYLNGNYTISNGKLDNYTIPITGSAPSSGYLTYEDDDLINGCLVINGYEAIYQNGKFTSTGKGDCGGVTPSIPTIPSCPGCVFAYLNDDFFVQSSPTPANTTNDYTTLSDHPYFLGLITNPNTGEIERAFACGIEGTTPFCIEGGVDERQAVSRTVQESNIEMLNEIFEDCEVVENRTYILCYSSTLGASSNYNGNVDVFELNKGGISILPFEINETS